MRWKWLFPGLIAAAVIFVIVLAIFTISKQKQSKEHYREALAYRLAVESCLILPDDNYKAIRIAEAAYKVSKSSPPSAVAKAFSAAAYSIRELPFYNAKFKHEGEIFTAIFSPGGNRIVTASKDGTAIVWLTPESIMEWLKTAPIPKLTPKEKEKLGIANFDID